MINLNLPEQVIVEDEVLGVRPVVRDVPRVVEAHHVGPEAPHTPRILHRTAPGRRRLPATARLSR